MASVREEIVDALVEDHDRDRAEAEAAVTKAIAWSEETEVPITSSERDVEFVNSTERFWE